MEDEYGWERFDEHLLSRFARVGGADLHSLWLRDMS